MKPLLTQPRRAHPHTQHQSGVALIVSLIMLVLMTLVGIAGIRVINAEERMVGQTYDRAVAFQAAEAALKQIEASIESAGQPTPAPSTACAVTGTAPNDLNVCGLNIGVPRWISSTFSEWVSSSPVVHTTGISITPQYFVEYLGSNFPCSLDKVDNSSCKRYRVTARANASDDRAAVMLQSVYATSSASGGSTATGP